MLSILLLLACGRSERSKVIEPGEGPVPDGAVMPLDVGNRVYGTDGDGRPVGGRVEHPVELGGNLLHRWVTDDDTHFFEQDGEDLLWWGAMTLGGRFERPLLLVPGDVKNGMIWEARDGSGGVTHLIAAERRPDIGFQNPGGPQDEGRTFTAWSITVEEITGPYEPLETLRTTSFLFYEGVGLAEVYVGGRWNSVEGFVGFGTGPVDHAMVTRGGPDVAPLGRQRLALEPTSVSFEGTIEQLAARTASNGDTQVFAPFHTREIVGSTAAGLFYSIATDRAGRCFTWNDAGLREENGCPTSFGPTPDASADGASDTSPIWFPERIGGLWSASNTYGFEARTSDVATFFRNASMVWSQAERVDGVATPSYRFGFSKAGVPDLHDRGEGDYEALIVDADGPVWRIVPGELGPTRELLGIVDLPDGHWLTGAVRMASPTAEGSRLLVSTTTGRFEPLRSPDVDPDPSVSTLWTTTVEDPTVPDVVSTDFGVVMTEAGVTACGLQREEVELLGFDGAISTSPAFGDLPCAVVDTPVDIPRRFPTEIGVRFASGAETERFTNATRADQAEVVLATFSDMLWVGESSALSRELRFNEALLPNGPGADFDLPDAEDIVVDHVSGEPFDARTFSSDGIVRSAGGGGIYAMEADGDVLTVRWTDGSASWERSFDGPATDAFAWADGRVCVLGLATAQCEGSDGVVREAPLVGLTATALESFVTPTHALRLTDVGAFAIDPETAESTLSASFDAPEVFLPLQTQAGDVWLMSAGNIAVQLSGADATFYAPPEMDDPSYTQRMANAAPVVMDGHLHTTIGIFEDEQLIQIRYRYPLVPLAEPPEPPVQELEPGTRVGDVTVGDVSSPGADVVSGGTTPDLAPTTLVETTADGIAYTDEGWVSLRDDGPVPLGFDGVEGPAGEWPGGVGPLIGSSDLAASPGGAFVWRQDFASAWRIQLDPLQVEAFDFVGTGVVARRVSDMAPDGTGVFVADALPNGDYLMGTVDLSGVLSTELLLDTPPQPSVSIARGGRLVAATTSSGDVGVYEASTGAWVADLHAADPVVREVAFDPTGRWLAVQTNTTLEQWSVQAGLPQDAFVRVGTISTLAREQLVWSPNGDRLIGMTPNTLEVFDMTPSGPVFVESVDLVSAFTDRGGVLGNSESTVVWNAAGTEFTFVNGSGSLLRFAP